MAGKAITFHLWQTAANKKNIGRIKEKEMNPYFVIDAGHGVNTPGKRSPEIPRQHQLYEWEFNKIMQNKLARLFYENGIPFTTYPSRVNDASLTSRATFINNTHNRMKGSDQSVIVISLHGNAFVNDRPLGSEVFTYIGQSESDLIAELICKRFQQSPITNIRIDESDGDLDKEAKFKILRDTIPPAVLIEFGFYTNEAERLKMLNNDWQEEMIRLVYDGLMDYIISKKDL